MSTDLIIDGVMIDRAAAKVVINRITLSLDAPDCVEFTEKCAALPGTFGAGSHIQIVVDGAPRFSGQIVGSYPQNIGRGCIDIGYRALGLNWLANQIWITGSDGGGSIVYNLPQTDGDYIPINSGLSVGDILIRLFELHIVQLTACGIIGFSAVDLARLTAVPPEPVVLTGRLWNAVQELLASWCNKWLIWIDADGLIQCESALDLHEITVRLDGEPVILDQIARDHSECYTQMIIRGSDLVEGAYLSLADGTLIPAWSAADQAAWTLADFYSPKGAADLGQILSMTSTTLTLQSDDPTATAAVNYLSDIIAEVWAYNPLASGIDFIEQRRITANTALTAGGTYTVTVDTPFDNSGYTRYSIRGQYATQSLVWRKFLIVPTYVAQHLVNRFSHSFPWSATDGVVTQAFTPQASVCYSSGCVKPYVEVPATFDIVPFDGVTNGYIVFNEPVVKAFGTITNLTAGGSSTDGIPCDLKVLAPYSRGAVSATAPTSGYEGTAFTVDGIQRTGYKDFPQWLDYRDQAGYQTIAQETLDTTKNTIVEGRFTHLSKYTEFLALGKAVNIAGNGYTTGYEAINAVVRSVVLDYCADGGPVPFVTRVEFSTRLRPFAGDRLYAHPAYGAAAALAGGFSSLSALAPTLGQWQARTAANTLGIVGPDQTEGEVPDFDPSIGTNTYQKQKQRIITPAATLTEGRSERKQTELNNADQAESMRRYLKSQEEKRKRGRVTGDDVGIDTHLADLAGGD